MTGLTKDVINIADFVTLVGDGVTDNNAALVTFVQTVKLIGKSMPSTVTVTIANPAVISWTGHKLRVNGAVVFSTTGALPTGIVAGTPYFVLSAGLTADSFRISTTNAWTNGGEGSAVVTSGSQSGVHSACSLGTEWQNIIWPPGAYFNGEGNFWGYNFSFDTLRTRLSAYGVSTNIAHFNSGREAFGWDNSRTAWALIQSQPANQSFATLVSSANSSKFNIGGWVLIAALDLQNTAGVEQSTPLNNHYFEYSKISAINSGTGVVTFETKLRNGYKSTYPLYYDGSDLVDPAGGGPATMYQMIPSWDNELEVYGLKITGAGGFTTNGKYRKFVDCKFSGGQIYPTGNKVFIAENCEWVNICEIDKLIEYLRFTNCIVPQLYQQSSSVDRLVIEGGTIGHLTGLAKNTHIKDSDIWVMQLAPAGYGAAETLTMENTRVLQLEIFQTPTSGVSRFDNLVSRFTFSNGTLRILKSVNGVVNSWTVPGHVAFVNDMNATYTSMGAPFKILDVREDGTYVYVDTTLASLPVGNSTSATVTMTIASPAVVTWTAHGLPAGTPIIFKTTGALPSGVTPSGDAAGHTGNSGKLYYVLASGLATDTFQFAATVGGTAIVSTGSQSGTHTAESNPLHFQTAPCPTVTVRNCTGCAEIVDLSNAPDAMPPFSYAKRIYTGDNYAANSGLEPRPPILWGNLVKLRVNVVRAYSGSNGTLTGTVSANAFDSSLLASNLSQTINLSIAGERIITPDATTGAQSGDTLAASDVWLSDHFKMDINRAAGGGDGLSQEPIVEVEVWTNQRFNPGVVLYYRNFIENTTTPGP